MREPRFAKLRFPALIAGALLIGLGLVVLLRSRSGGPSDVRGSSGSGPAVSNDTTDLAGSRGELERQTAIESDRVPGSTAVQPSTDLTVAVVADEDRPVAGAHVLLFDRQGLRGEAVTGEDGLCSLAAVQVESEVLVWTLGRAPQRQVAQPENGRILVRLHDGARVSGVVRHPDGAPAANVRLLLVSDRARIDVDGIPDSVIAALPRKSRWATDIESETDEAGRFAFLGLDNSWGGKLALEVSHWSIESSRGTLLRTSGWPYHSGVSLDSAVEGLLLTAVELPAITGRIVTADGSTGVPRANIECTIGLHEANSMMLGAAAGEDGRFRIPVTPINVLDSSAWLERHEFPSTRGLRIHATGRANSGAADLVIDDARVERGVAVGDIALARARAIVFVAVDSKGDPVSGAVARTDSGEPSRPTDSRGHGEIDGVAEDATHLIACARGYAVTRIDLPPNLAQELSITLAETNRLMILVRGAQGELPKKASVEVASAESLFAGAKSFTPDKVQVGTGDSRLSGAKWGPKGGSIQFAIERGSPIELSDLVAGRPLTIRVMDALGDVVQEEPPIALGPVEKRTLEIVVKATFVDLEGRVLDDKGEPLADAQVALRSGGTGTGCGTGPRGEFLIQGVSGGPFELAISRPGYTPFLLPSFELPKDGRPVEFRLSPGNRVRVRVVDMEDRPIKDSRVRIGDLALRDLPHEQVGEGVFEFQDVPARTLRFVAYVGGIDYAVEHDCVQPEAKIVVPPHGSIELHVPKELSIEPHVMVKLDLSDPKAPDPASKRELDPTEREDGTLRFGSVLPGEYQGKLEAWTAPQPGGEFHWQAIGRTVSIVVRANETVRVDLER